MFGFIKKVFIVSFNFSSSLANVVNFSDHKKCISLNSQPCMTRPILIDLNPDKYSQGLHYYLFMVNLDRCNRSCNTLDDLSNRICVTNNIEDVNLSVFHMIRRINESKTLTKQISCKYKCKFDGRKCNFKIRDLIRSITNNSENHDEKYMKIKFNSDDDLLLKKC